MAYRIQRYFGATICDLQKLCAFNKGKLYSHVNASIHGIDTIRAANKNNEFIKKCEDLLNKDNQGYFVSFTANRWLAIRTECMGVLLIGIVAFVHFFY